MQPVGRGEEQVLHRYAFGNAEGGKAQVNGVWVGHKRAVDQEGRSRVQQQCVPKAAGNQLIIMAMRMTQATVGGLASGQNPGMTFRLCGKICGASVPGASFPPSLVIGDADCDPVSSYRVPVAARWLP